MRHLSITTALLAILGGAALSAAETPANTLCPMSGKPINPALGCVPVKLGDGPDAPTVQVGTCSKECADMLIADGKKYRMRVWATTKDQGTAGKGKAFSPDEVKDSCCNIKCPVDGKPIDPALKPLPWKLSDSPKNPNAGKLVLIGFCSADCMDAFKKAPEKYEEALWNQDRNKLVK